MSTTYTAGWNQPGYLPETDPVTFESWAEALAYLVETVDRFWDEDADNDRMHNTHGADNTWLGLHTALHVATESDGHFLGYDSEQSLAFFITPTDPRVTTPEGI